MEKRGRKRKNELYFGPDEEEAVVSFLTSDNEEERNLIFNEWLMAPLEKMVESIIRRYKLYRSCYTFEELRDDTISFLITKVDRFEPDLNKKAYSFFGTICKNYVLGLLIKDKKMLTQSVSYEDVTINFDERDDLQYEIEDDVEPISVFIKKIVEGIKEELNTESTLIKKKLTENEIKLGYALIEILENWEVNFDEMDGTNKFNKNSVLETIRNYTNLSTKDIRIAMKRYKVMYKFLKEHQVNN